MAFFRRRFSKFKKRFSKKKKQPSKVSLTAGNKKENIVINKLVSAVRGLQRSAGLAKNYVHYKYTNAFDTALPTAPNQPLVVNLMNPQNWTQIFGNKDSLDLADNKVFNPTLIMHNVHYKITAETVGAFVIDHFIVSPKKLLSDWLADVVLTATFNLWPDYTWTGGTLEHVTLNPDFFVVHQHKRIYLANRQTKNTGTTSDFEVVTTDAMCKFKNVGFRKYLKGVISEKRQGFKNMNPDEVPTSQQIYMVVWCHRLYDPVPAVAADLKCPYWTSNTIVKGWTNE